MPRGKKKYKPLAFHRKYVIQSKQELKMHLVNMGYTEPVKTDDYKNLDEFFDQAYSDSFNVKIFITHAAVQIHGGFWWHYFEKGK